MNKEISREYKTVDNNIFEEAKIDTEYVTSMRSDDRVTVYWSSHLDLPKTLAVAQNTLGDPIMHMNSTAIFRNPETNIPFSADHHTPVILDWANKLPEHIDRAQVPHDGMAVGWAKVPNEFRGTMHGPYQLRVTAEQQIARAVLYRLILDSGSPQIGHNLDSVLAALEYDFKPLSRGASKRSEEWQAMHQTAIAGDHQQAA